MFGINPNTNVDYTEEEKKKILQELKEYEEYMNGISREEELYRRGFSHGFAAACRSPKTSLDEVIAWQKDRSKIVGAPGTSLAGVELGPQPKVSKR